jgi:hypothetical protein
VRHFIELAVERLSEAKEFVLSAEELEIFHARGIAGLR